MKTLRSIAYIFYLERSPLSTSLATSACRQPKANSGDFCRSSSDLLGSSLKNCGTGPANYKL